jgi:hypothetical protein
LTDHQMITARRHANEMPVFDFSFSHESRP